MALRIINRIKRFYILKIKKVDAMSYKINNYRKIGITIGKNCRLYGDLPEGVDSFLITIKDDVIISSNVSFINHDAAIFNHVDGGGSLLGEIVIGNRCFIGNGTIILPGVCLADDTIVAAGSVVTKGIDKPGYVIGGNPAKVICTVEEYKAKNKNRVFNLIGLNGEQVKDIVKDNDQKKIKRRSLL